MNSSSSSSGGSGRSFNCIFSGQCSSSSSSRHPRRSCLVQSTLHLHLKK